MSERPRHRRPATFKLDDPSVIVIDPDEAEPPVARHGPRHAGSRSALLAGADRGADCCPRNRGFRWGTLFWTALGGLVLLGARAWRHRT